MVILTPGKSLIVPAFAHARHQLGRHEAERQERLVETSRRPHRHVVGLGGLHGVAAMIAVAVRHPDQVDLAELAEILELVGQLGLRERGAGERPQALAVFQGGSCRFSVSA
jgi:hypothetical protein